MNFTQKNIRQQDAKLATNAICSANGCTNTNTNKCTGGCNNTFYCSKKCQKKHLKHHKKTCPYFKKKNTDCIYPQKVLTLHKKQKEV